MSNQTEQLDKLSFEFFRCFSLLEYALKEVGHVGGKGKDNFATVAYEKYFEDNSQHYVASDSALLLINLSPKMQVCVGKALHWHQVDFGSDLRGITKCVKTIRNNLFHGGKRGPHGWFDSARVHELLSVGIVVIDELAQVNAELYDRYCGRA